MYLASRKLEGGIGLVMGTMFVGHGALNDLNRRNFPPDEIVLKVRLSKAVPRRKLRE